MAKALRCYDNGAMVKQEPREGSFSERALQGMYVRADERLAKRLRAKGKHREVDAAT